MTDEDKRKAGRLLEVLEAYGADPARWPVADREALLDLMTPLRPAWLERASAEAAALDALLDEARIAEAPDGAVARTIAAARGVARPRSEQPRTARARPMRLPAWGTAAALAASLALGFWLGAAGVIDGSPVDPLVIASSRDGTVPGEIDLLDPAGLLRGDLL